MLNPFFSLDSLSLTNLNDKNFPKYCAKAMLASLPEGSKSPYRRSMISISSPLLKFALVPSIYEARVLTGM